MTDPIARLLGEWANDMSVRAILLKLTLTIIFSAIWVVKEQAKDILLGLELL